VNVRSSPCGSIATTLANGAQKNVASASLETCSLNGKEYAWVNLGSGWVAINFLDTCTGTSPPPASRPCQFNGKPSNIGTAGLDMITKWEGIVPCWYRDPVGYPTICIGHLITHNEYHQGECLTTAQCEALLKSDLGSYVSCVKNAITAPINQNQFDALVDFVYNLGCGSLGGGLASTINRGNYGGACGIIKEYVYAGGQILQGLVNRRADECNLFNSCGGVNFAGSYRQCAVADACSSCILNSENDATFTLYDNLGYNTSCDATIWANLANDWCTNVNPWECYWKVNGLTGADNGTSLCPMCPSKPMPTVPQPGTSDVSCISSGAMNLCGVDDCATQLDGSVCDPNTGACVMAVTSTPVIALCNSTAYDFVTSPASYTQIFLAFGLFLAVLLAF